MAHNTRFVTSILAVAFVSYMETNANASLQNSHGGHIWLLPTISESHSIAMTSTLDISEPWTGVVRIGLMYGRCKPNWAVKYEDERLLKVLAAYVKQVSCVQLNNDTVSAMADVFSYKVDVLGASVWPPAQKFHYDYIYPHRQDDMCILIKRLDPQWQSIFQSFTFDTWIATGVSLVIFAGTLHLSSRRYDLLETLRTFITGVFYIQRKHPLSNYLFLLLSAFGVVMVAAFCGTFMTYLTILKELRQPNTIEEVNNRVMKVHGKLGDALPLLENLEENDAVVQLLRKVDYKFDDENMTHDVSSSLEAAFVSTRQDLLQWQKSRKFMDKSSGRELTHLVSECIMSPAYQTYIIRFDWAHKEHFSMWVQRAVEAGIPLKIKSEYMYYLEKLGRLIHTPAIGEYRPPVHGPRTIKMAAMKDTLALLGGGLALATLAFLLEMAVHRHGGRFVAVLDRIFRFLRIRKISNARPKAAVFRNRIISRNK